MSEGTIDDAEEYIDTNMRLDSGNMGLIAWRFLIGCRILEYMEKMQGAPKQGADVKFVFSTKGTPKEIYGLRLGDYEITLAHKPEGEHESS
tara:strand:- start:1212 stop:1484 length:273 start_codon:yes stop_codon:yes gene_type:complete